MPSMARFPIKESEVSDVVRIFYSRVRQHETLGPIFYKAIGSDAAAWEAHEAKIEAFWRNALLMDRAYNGNPMVVHAQNPSVHAEHFPIWLGLFQEVLDECLEEDLAAGFSALAHRIGRGLSLGLQTMRQSADEPPSLL